MLAQSKHQMRSKKAKGVGKLTKEQTAGKAIILYLSMSILNHVQCIEFVQRFLDTYDALPVSGFSLLQRFQKHRHFAYLPMHKNIKNISTRFQPDPIVESLSIPCSKFVTGGYGPNSTIGQRHVSFADVVTEIMVVLSKSPKDCMVGAPRFSQTHPNNRAVTKTRENRLALSFFFGNISIWGALPQANFFR